MINKKFSIIKTIVLLSLMIIQGCASNMLKPDLASDSPEYNIFYSASDHVVDLLKVGNEKEAVNVYEKNRSFFRENRDDEINVILSIIEIVDKNSKQELVSQKNTLINFNNRAIKIEDWPKIKNLYNEIEKKQNILNNYQYYAEYTKNNAIVKDINRLKKSLNKKLEEKIGNAFRSFDHKKGNFSKEYPVKVTPIVIEKNIDVLEGIAKKSKAKEILEIKNNLHSLLSENKRALELLGNIYYKKVYEDKDLEILNHLNALRKTLNNGLLVSDQAFNKVAIIDDSSNSLLKSGQLEFPISLKLGILEKSEAANLEDSLKNYDKYEYIFIFSNNIAKTERRIKKRNKQDSRYVSGTRRLTNPRYERARMTVREAQNNKFSVDNQYCYGLACLAKVVAQAAASSKLEEAKNQFSQISPTIKENIYSSYDYSSSTIISRKMASTNYYIIETKSNKIISGHFDLSEKKSFSVAYGVHKNDKNKNRILRKHDSEEDVSEFEKKPIYVSLEDLIKHAEAKYKGANIIKPSYSHLKATILADRHKAIENSKLASDDVYQKDDKRLEHVVAIYSPDGSLGSGFYISPELVLTNYHVIEGSKYAEIKLYNGDETFGKVVKSDVRLDLALVKVQQRGKPVELYTGSIPLGSTVEAVGHPEGLEFSITRGVVSAIRERENVYGIGGKKVRFIQTDTPINKGNSGGPMFLGDKVIGVNNNKKVGSEVEGLAFSIHFVEVNDFMREDF